MFITPEMKKQMQEEAREMAEALELWLEKEEEAERRNRRGAGFALLNPVRAQIALLMSRGKPMKDIHRALDEALGIQVNLKTLRKFVADHMEEEFQTYMSAGPRKRAVTQTTTGSGKPREEAEPEKAETKPAATGEKSTTRIDPAAIGLSSEDRKALADEEARRINETYNQGRKPKP